MFSKTTTVTGCGGLNSCIFCSRRNSSRVCSVGGTIGKATDLQFTGRGFELAGYCCIVAFDKLFKPVHLCHQAVKFGTDQFGWFETAFVRGQMPSCGLIWYAYFKLAVILYKYLNDWLCPACHRTACWHHWVLLLSPAICRQLSARCVDEDRLQRLQFLVLLSGMAGLCDL